MKCTHSYLYWRDISLVFRADSMLDANIARLCVLYEDLRIEVNGIAADSTSALDKLSEKYRRNLFLRRSILTLHEFAEAFAWADRCSAFQEVKGRFDAPFSERWNRAVRYFAKYKPVLKKIRNDLGGHYGLEAAKFAVDNLIPGANEKIEINVYDSSGGGAKLHFVGELVATTALRHISGSDSGVKTVRLIRIVRVGFEHAVRATNLIIRYYLLEKFRGTK